MRGMTFSGLTQTWPAQQTSRFCNAQAESRIIVTFDKDFGELAFRSGLPATSGVILFRVQTKSPEHIRDRVMNSLLLRSDWTGHFFVVNEHRIRVRPLPTSDDEES